MKQKNIFVKQCHWCKSDLTMNGKEADSYVINAEHLVFCKIHLPGKEPEKDCMEDYINEKKEKQKRLLSQKKEQLQEEKEKVLTDKNTALKKLAELKQFLSKKKTIHPS